jgi:MHS family proline/betaine transporter-like MFS transporter
MSQQALTKEQREAVGLLSIGTFLEYFDLMLYVHMAVLLNELFFPKYDPHATQLLTALAFCSTFVLRPLGALIFGWIGDHIGRRITVIITTTLMAASCFVMANLPTYAQIGVSAGWIVTICRMVQGISSMGEIIGAQIYLTEISKPPIQYPLVASIVMFSTLGTVAALGLASAVTSFGLDWRLAFWFGAGIAIVGIVARTTLRETPDFADAKRQLEKLFGERTNDYKDKLKISPIWREKVKLQTSISYFLIECMWPVTFYFVYLHCSNILKQNFNYTTQEVIHHNFIVAIVNLLSYIVLTYLSYKIYPLIITKIRVVIFWISLLFLPYLLDNINTAFQVMLIQSFFIIFRPDAFPSTSIFIKHFPILKRFTHTSWLFAMSRALMHVVTSFGLVYLIKSLGNAGLLIIMIPASIGFIIGVLYFSELEKRGQ